MATLLTAPDPFSFVLFGASGHLAILKIYPALYVLALKKRLPRDYIIMGYARSDMDDASFRKLVEDSIRAAFEEVTEKALQEFLTHVHYHHGQYDSVEDYKSLSEKLQKLEHVTSIRLAYLSIPPKVFPAVLKNLREGGVKSVGPFRCIVEKPVGHDLKSFEVIREELTSSFDPSEIFLLDHYLGKEAVRNVYYLRYANPILERLFKNSLIHRVEITALEPGGIEGRTGYFEHTGTLRDMVQSHLFMISALLTTRLHEDDDIPELRRNALEQFYLPPASNLGDVIVQGQYESGSLKGEAIAGYREEPDVATDSRTNTFVALKLLTRTSRWQGVPFYLRTGKRMAKKETRISIQFQTPYPIGEGSAPNRLDIILQGEAGMKLYLQTKIGGSEPAFRPLIMADPLVCVGDCLPEHGLLLLEAINGKQQWFLHFEEVRSAWRLIDPLQAHLESSHTLLHLYPAGTNGPKEAEKWIQREGTQWLE